KLECFKLLFDAKAVRAEDQFPGWPKMVNITDNYARKAAAWLPEISVSGLSQKPVFQVYDDKGQLVYALRSPKNHFRAKVFASGEYTVKVGDPDTNQWKTLKLKSGADQAPLQLNFAH
ncbi:MAG: hypothetical protein HRT88_03965, partial [Lentisphaeraceae bacterium]|nr:hypothetical protein [Lentisphaeraceae bacterium]